jgi:photosystem II stability/assembly factor-like uncharacterized protein
MNALSGIWGSGSADIYVVGAFTGDVLHSADGGATWQVQPTGAPGLIDVWGLGANDVYAVGGKGGTIARTQDGGQTWTKQTLASTTLLTGVWGTRDRDLYVVGYFAAFHATDGGASWPLDYLALNGGQQEVSAIWGSRANDVYAVSSDGILHIQ